MKDISIYFQPIGQSDKLEVERIGKHISKHTLNSFPEILKGGVAIFNVPEYRNDKLNKDLELTSDFREELYKLYRGYDWDSAIYDLGTIKPGENISDTHHAIATVSSELIKKNVIPIIIGGSQDLTMAMYSAYEKLEQLVNITTIDNQLDLGNLEQKENLHHEGWLSHILLNEASYLFNYSNLGAQAHYISNKTLNLFEELYFDVCRLGDVNSNIELTEPYMRNTDIVSVDLTSIRAADLQNKNYTSPNGLFSHDICRMMRYAGISDKLSSIGIFNYYSQGHKVTDELVAQLIWYFIEGYSQRKGDFPIGNKKSYTKFRVFMQELNEEIIFYKSDKSGRWWIEVPYPGKKESKYIRHQMVPCSFDTYQEAMKGGIPDLWWKTYQKLG